LSATFSELHFRQDSPASTQALDALSLRMTAKEAQRFDSGFQMLTLGGYMEFSVIEPKLSVSAQENRSNTAITHYFK
jgi:hypothetical protein